MELLVFVTIILAISIFLAEAGILLWIKKLFKIEKPTYKNSLKILAFLSVAGIVVGMVVNVIDLDFLSDVLVVASLFFVLHYFLKKYHQSSWKKSLSIYIVFGVVSAVVSLFVIIPIRLYIFSPFAVAGEAMSPMYTDGDYLLINKLDRNFQRGDVVIFKDSKNSNKFFIKRVIGLPSEKVDIQNNKVAINEQILEENYINGDTSGSIYVTLNQDQYFVLSDNRNKNFDSRDLGPIVKSNIQGKVFYKVPNR